MSLSVLVTGATGFIGNALIQHLALDARISVKATTHQNIVNDVNSIELFKVHELSRNTDWLSALKNVDIVIHTAARTHIMRGHSNDLYSEYQRVNTDGTLKLARQAASLGVKRFIFLSSIKVNGEWTLPGIPFHAEDNPAPIDPYAISKWETEKRLMEIAQDTGMEVVLIRPPLVYGPGVKGNFLTMIRWVLSGFPLPLGMARDNQRSLVGLYNLIDLIVTCLEHPAAANEVILVSDGVDLSTTELLQKIAEIYDASLILLPIPEWLMIVAGKLIGKREEVNRLYRSLQVDCTKTRELLAWEPPISIEEGLMHLVKGYTNDKAM